MINTYTIDNNLIHQVSSAVFSVVDKNKFKVFIFGSTANTTATEKSDIDIGVMSVSTTPVTNQIIYDIRESLDKLPSLKSFDIINFDKASKEFKQEALKATIDL